MMRAGLALAALPVAFLSTPAAAAICDVSSPGVNFGNYDPLSSSATDGVGNINVSCDAEVSFTITLSSGMASYAERHMIAGANVLAYNLYVDAARVMVWGDGTAGTSTVSATATIADRTVYGRLPPRQSVPAGSYIDTITVTITY